MNAAQRPTLRRWYQVGVALLLLQYAMSMGSRSFVWQAVASFHGLFSRPEGLTTAPITAKVIACHGWDDPMVPPAEVVALGEELTEAGADWQIHAYGGTMLFTLPLLFDRLIQVPDWTYLTLWGVLALVAGVLGTNFQLRLDAAGVPKLFEINARFSGTTPFCAELGMNPVEDYLKRSRGIPYHPSLRTDVDLPWAEFEQRSTGQRVKERLAPGAIGTSSLPSHFSRAFAMRALRQTSLFTVVTARRSSSGETAASINA